MVFERSLRIPISNWNISNDKFIFQESKDSSTVFVVRLFLDKPPILFEFHLPAEIAKNRINSYYDKVSKKIVIPKEVEKGTEHLHMDFH